jgi:hypothetical protein
MPTTGFTTFSDYILNVAALDAAQMHRILICNPDLKAACRHVVTSIPVDITKPAPGDLAKITAAQFMVFDNWDGKNEGRGLRHRVGVKLWTGKPVIWSYPEFQGNADCWAVATPKDRKATMKRLADLHKAGTIDAPAHVVDFLLQQFDAEYIGVVKSTAKGAGSHYHSRHWVFANLTTRNCVMVVQANDGTWGLRLGPDMWDRKGNKGKPLSQNAIWSIRHAPDGTLHEWTTGEGESIMRED